MIDLEKQKEPSEEEIQEWVNEVYEYAVNLYTNHNILKSATALIR